MATVKRSTVYNAGLVTDEKWAKVNEQNKQLLKDFIEDCDCGGKSPATIKQYTAQLKIFFVYVMEHCNNVFFVDLKKKDLIKFAGWLQNTLKSSGKRISSFKSVISSISNYIERVLDEDYPNFRNISHVITVASIEPVREKTILSEEQVMECLDKLVEDKKYQIACFMALLYASGMRKAEAVQMLVEDFEEKNVVMNGVFYKTRKIRTKGPGKAGKQLNKYVFKDIFDPYFKLWMEDRKNQGIISPYLFITYNDGNYIQAHVSTATSFASVLSDYLGVPAYCHNFRHAWCTRLHKLGYPETVIQMLQGWSGLAMVSLYNDTSEEEELEGFFSKLSSEENS